MHQPLYTPVTLKVTWGQGREKFCVAKSQHDLAALDLCLQCPGRDGDTSHGRKEYRVLPPPTDAKKGHIDRPRELDWSYPVLRSARFPNLKKLNKCWLST
jgi:hypothetical protein